MKDVIGVVGAGFVGGAIINFFTPLSTCEVLVYDKDPSKKTHELRDLANECDIIFVCVPTPMKQSGECDTSIVESVIEEIDTLASEFENYVSVVIKSTVPPTTTERLQRAYPHNVDLCFNPEFLTEANADKDFAEQKNIIVGGVIEVYDFYKKYFPLANVIICSSGEAEMIKYVANTFLTTKVLFLNEIKQICEASGIDYDNVAYISKLDPRLGTSHWKVPGPDGHYGVGGTCFPKDLGALIAYAKSVDVDPSILEAVKKKNLEVRPEKDWEQLKGRAVSDETN